MSGISLFGIVSGFDSSAIFKALTNQQRSGSVTLRENKITALADTNAAFDTLTDLLTKLSTTASKLTDSSGSAIAKSATSSNSSVVNVSATNSASNGSYSITVNSLASNGIYTFSDSFASIDSVVNASINDAAPAADRTLNYTVGGESVDVVLTSTTTVSDVVNAFNQASTKGVLTAVNVGTSTAPDYRLSLSSTGQGVSDGAISTTRGADLSALGIFDDATATKQIAANASLDITGVGAGIERSSNSISDIVSGVTFNLQSTGSATVTISNDGAATQDAVTDFVSAFNDVIKFVKQNDAIHRDITSPDGGLVAGPLVHTSLDENIVIGLRAAISSFDSSGQSVNLLADLGIFTSGDGTLSFNTDTFQTAVSNGSSEVTSLLNSVKTALSSSSGIISQFTQLNGLIDQSQSLNEREISDQTQQISNAESRTISQEKSLTRRYAEIESLIGQLDSQAQLLAQVKQK